MGAIRFCDSCQGSIPLGAPSMEREGKRYCATCWRVLFGPAPTPVEHGPIWVAPRDHEPPSEHVQMIERTAKRWKGQQLIGAGVACTGAAVFAVNATAGAILVAVGLVQVIAFRIVAWWHHG